jgi:replication-associated recombination protein RarA
LQDFIGLAKVKATLQPFIKAPFVSRWLFIGPSGVGKTILAQAVAREINAQLHEVPSAECDLERVLHETHMCRYGAFNFDNGKTCLWHIVAIHEAHKITGAAQLALLSKMDSTAAPPQTIFIFTSNSKANLEVQFLSRCNILEFTSDSMEDELAQYLDKIYKLEGGKHPLDFDAIAKASQFNVRDALNRLQIELLIGTNRKDLPTEDLKIIPTHSHDCEKCHRPWKHSELKCKLPHVTVCPECGGANTTGQLRAQKAWVTIKKNIAAELRTKSKRKGKAA